jgi:hypothetical protein
VREDEFVSESFRERKCIYNSLQRGLFSPFLFLYSSFPFEEIISAAYDQAAFLPRFDAELHSTRPFPWLSVASKETQSQRSDGTPRAGISNVPRAHSKSNELYESDFRTYKNYLEGKL